MGLVLTAPVVLAQTSWKGTSSTAWATAANWTAGVPTASVDAIIGDANFTGTNQPTISATAVCRSLTLGTGTKASTLTVTRALTVSGNITIGTNGIFLQSGTRVISLTGNWTNSGAYAGSSTGSPITFSGTAQFIGGTTATGFRKLTINAGSVLTLASNISVTNSLSVSGTLDPGTGSGFAVSGAGTLSVASGAKILVRATTFAGNYATSGTKTLSAGSTVEYAAAGNQTVDNTLTYRTLRISGSGVKSLAGNLPSLSSSTTAQGNLYIDAATLDLSTFTANRNTSTTGGTLSIAVGATLRIGGTNTMPANYATHSLVLTSTVEYYGTNQTVRAETYGNLILSSSGAATKTMPASAFTVSGKLTSATNAAGASVSFTAGAAITVNGGVTLGGGTTFNGSSFNITNGGNWTNNGTFTGSTSTVTLSGASTVLTGTGANNFNNLTITGSGVTATTTTSLTVAGNFTTSGAGTFTHTTGGTGTVTMSGAGKSISGTGITFNKLTITGTNSTSASFTVADDLTVNGSLTNTAGTITLSGTGKTIAGTGVIVLFGLSVPGSITTTNNFSLAGDLNVTGTFTATAGMTTFAGSTVFSGTANLFNATLNGTFLQMHSDSTLRLAGTTTLIAGNFDVTNQRPNTIVYNSAGSQTVYPITYDNLEIAPGGTKSAIGNINVLGDFTIDPGAVFSGGSGGYTNYMRKSWLNYGTFTAGNSTVEFVGPANSTISGATTFNQLRVNKDASSLLVNLGTNQTVATLDMALGKMDTGTNTLTITTTRTGNGIVLGTITRQHSFSSGTDYAFESPYNTIHFASLTSVSSVTVAVAVGSVSDFASGGTVNRQYTVSLSSSGAYSATFRAHYEDAELNGNDETVMALWKNSGSGWALSGKTGNDSANNWVEQSGITGLAARWTMSADSGVVRWNGSVSTAWETAANWTIVSGSPSRPPSTNDIAELGTTSATYQPTIASAATAKSLSFGSAQAMTLTLGSGGSLQTVGNVAGVWTNNATHTLDVGAQTLTLGGDLVLSDGTSGHAINLSLSSGTVTVADQLVESGGADVTFTGAGTLNVGGDFLYSSGTFTPGSGTVTYTGSEAQAVGGVTYQQLTFNKPSGIATLSSAASVNGHLTLTNGGRFRLNADLLVVGSVLIRTNTILDLGGMAIDVGGDWVCEGTLNISSGGEVALIGTGVQSIGACAFHDFDVEKPSGTAILMGTISVNADADVTSGTLDLSTFTISRGTFGAYMTVAAGARLRTANGFPTNFAALYFDPASTVEYYGSGDQTIEPATYGNLILTNGNSNPKTLASSITVAGDLLIGSNATLAASSNSLTLYGNWTNNGTFSGGTGTLLLSGTNKFVSGNTTLNNLTVVGSYTSVSNLTLVVNGNVTILGTYVGGNGNTTIDGDFLNQGSVSGVGNLTFSGTRLQTLQIINAIQSVSSGTVNFNGTVSPVLYSTTPPAFANVNINNTGGITAGGGWTVVGRFKVAAGSSFNGSSFTHTFRGSVTNNGTMTSDGTFNFNPLSATTLELGTNFSSTGIVAFRGTNQITISSGALSLGSVLVMNTHATGITPVSNWTLTDDLEVDGGATFHAGVGFTHTIGGNVQNNSSLDGGTSLIVFNGTSTINGAGSTVFNHVSITGSLTDFVNVSVTGNFTNNGTFDTTGVDLNFTGNAAAFIAGSTTPTTIDSLVIAKSSTNVTLAVNISELSALAISSGTLDTAAFSVSQNSTDGGTLNVGASGTLKLGGSSTFPTFTLGVTLDPACTVNYGGTAQTVAAITYANLILNGSGNKTLSSTTTINGNLEINGIATFNLSYPSASFSPVGSLTLGGALQVAGTWGSTSSSAANKENTHFQGTGKLNVGNRTLDHFAVTTPGAQTAGTSFTITTITAQDANNNTITTFVGTVDLTETGDGGGGTVTPSQSSAFTAGVLSGQSVTLTKAGAAVTVTVTDHAGTLKSGATDPFTVIPGALHHYAVTFSSPPFNTSVPFITFVTAQDANNNTTPTNNSTTVMVSSSSTNMEWEAPGTGEFNNGLESGQENHITRLLTNGVASFNTRDLVAETATITATSTVPAITGTSSAITIDPLVGAYRSKASGNWSAAGTWETNNGSIWQAASVAPSASSAMITIQSPHTVTVASGVTVDQVYVQSGAQLNVNSGVTLTIGNASNPGLEVNGLLHNEGTLTFNSGNNSFVWPGGVLENLGTINSAFETLEFEPGSPGGKYRHLFTTTAGTIPTAEWEVGSVCEVAGYTSNTTPPSGLNQSFHHFTWNCPSQTGTIALSGSPASLGGDFTVASTGSGALTLGGNLAVAGTATVSGDARLNCDTYTITGASFILGSGGTLGIGSPDGITSSGTSGNIQTTTRSFSTDGNYIYNGTAAQSAGSGLPASVNNLTIANSAGVTFSGTLSVYTACTINGSALFTAGGTISGLVTVNGTLNPDGSGVGSLNTVAENWNSGGTYEFEINDAAGTAGANPGWDLLNGSGALTVNATSGSRFTIQVVSLNDSSAGSAANFDRAQSYSWRIATASGGVSSFAANKFTINTSGFQNSTYAGSTFSISQSGNDVYLNFTPALPVLSVITNRTLDELTALTVTNAVTNTDMVVNYSLLAPPSGATINTNGVITWTPTEAQGPSTNTITTRVEVNGASSLSATNSFTMTVNEVNVAPVLTVPANQTIAELRTLFATNTATDADIPANTLTFSLVSAPAGMGINPSSGVITWIPTDAQGPSINTVAVRVTDNGSPNLSTTNSFTVTVSTVTNAGLYVAATNYPAGSGPMAICLAGLRGNGLQRDIAVANYNDDTVGVRLCIDDGTFGQWHTYPVGSHPAAVAYYYLDGDKYDDLVTANAGTNTVSVLINLGNGVNFRAATNFTVGSTPNPEPRDVAVADVSGDGRGDLLVANARENTVSVLTNLGGGVFSAPVNYAVGTGPWAIIAADMNGDGILDIVTADRTNGTLSILPGQGDGTFGAKQTIPLSASGNPQPMDLIPNDLNGDGVLDLAVANYGSNTASILIGTTNGGNWTVARNDLYGVGTNPVSLSLRDFNGDGIPDLSVVNSGANSVTIFFGKGDGTFESQVTLGVGSNPMAIAGSNFNGDGTTDFAVANYGSDSVSILLYGGPVAFNVGANVNEDTPTPITLTGSLLNGGTLIYITNGPAHGVLSGPTTNLVYTPETNYFGADSFTYRTSDGVLTSSVATVTLNVLSVNDRPGFDLSATSVTVMEDAALTNFANFATNLVKGPANESNQVVTFVVTTTNASFFITKPAISVAGVLSFRPALKTNGTVTVVAQMNDNGGTVRGGTNLSFPRSFNIAVLSYPLSTLTRQTNGVGTVAATSTAYGTPTNGATLMVGRSYTVTGTAGANYHFDHWDLESASESSTNSATTNVLTFVMRTNLTVRANFYTNAPGISVQPASRTNAQGTMAGFSVTAVGVGLGYQWRTNGVAIPGATLNTYTNLAVNTNDAGLYTVAVSNGGGSVTSSPAQLTVTLDANKPAVVISSPLANQEFLSPEILVKGTAADNARVTNVWLSLNEGAFGPAGYFANSSPTSATWSNVLTLVAGTNTVTVKSVDFAGNESALATRKFFLRTRSTLTLATNGLGSITSVSNSYTFLYGQPTNGAGLYLGRGYTVTAVDGSNWIFSNWLSRVDGGPNTLATNHRTLTFNMETNLQLTAVFVTNMYNRAVGEYNGLFSDPVSGPSVESAGFFKLAFTAANALAKPKPAFGGTLYLDGFASTFSGTFEDLGGNGVSATVVRPGLSSLKVYLHVGLGGEDQITGTVSNLVSGGWVANLVADRGTFNTSNHLATSAEGIYTMIISNNPATAPVDSPGGDGYLTVTVARTNGLLQAQGYLADGHTLLSTLSVTQPGMKVSVSKNGDWPLFAQLYKDQLVYYTTNSLTLVVTTNTKAQYNGILMGWVHVDNGSADGLDTASSDGLYWIKRATVTNAANFYTNGFTNPPVQVVASTYILPAPNTRQIPLNDGNGALTLFDNGVDAPQTNIVYLALNNNWLVNLGGDMTGLRRFAAPVVANTLNVGSLLGYQTNTLNPNAYFANIRGVVLQNQNLVRGAYGMGTNQSGYMRIDPYSP